MRASADIERALDGADTAAGVSGERLESEASGSRVLLGLGGTWRKGRLSLGAQLDAVGPGSGDTEYSGRVSLGWTFQRIVAPLQTGRAAGAVYRGSPPSDWSTPRFGNEEARARSRSSSSSATSPRTTATRRCATRCSTWREGRSRTPDGSSTAATSGGRSRSRPKGSTT